MAPSRAAGTRPQAAVQGRAAGRAVTRRNRTVNNIETLVLHTPEGTKAGTLSVLQGTRAGFDLFLASDGDLYKCNDWFRYVAWQAGDRA